MFLNHERVQNGFDLAASPSNVLKSLSDLTEGKSAPVVHACSQGAPHSHSVSKMPNSTATMYKPSRREAVKRSSVDNAGSAAVWDKEQ